MAIRLNAATNRNTSFGLPWSMMAPKISGEIMPPILKPVVTKPNTLPNEPGGVTSRTIMSREGMITPEQKPAADIALRDQRDEQRDPGQAGGRHQSVARGADDQHAADQHANRRQQ